MLGGRQVYAKLFHADIKADGPIRRNRPLILTGLSKTGEAPGRLVKDMTIRLEKGRLPLETPRPEDGVIQSMVEALRNAGAATDDERIAAAIMAAGTAPLPQPANDCPPEPPVSSSQPMLEATTAKQEGDEGEGVAPGPGTRGHALALIALLLRRRGLQHGLTAADRWLGRAVVCRLWQRRRPGRHDRGGDPLVVGRRPGVAQGLDHALDDPILGPWRLQWQAALLQPDRHVLDQPAGCLAGFGQSRQDQRPVTADRAIGLDVGVEQLGVDLPSAEHDDGLALQQTMVQGSGLPTQPAGRVLRSGDTDILGPS